MVVVAQLVRALVCGTRGRRFEPGLPPKKSLHGNEGSFLFYTIFFYLLNLGGNIFEKIYPTIIASKKEGAKTSSSLK